MVAKISNNPTEIRYFSVLFILPTNPQKLWGNFCQSYGVTCQRPDNKYQNLVIYGKQHASFMG